VSAIKMLVGGAVDSSLIGFDAAGLRDSRRGWADLVVAICEISFFFTTAAKRETAAYRDGVWMGPIPSLLTPVGPLHDDTLAVSPCSRARRRGLHSDVVELLLLLLLLLLLGVTLR